MNYKFCFDKLFRVLSPYRFAIGLTLAFALALGLQQEEESERFGYVKEAMDFTAKVCLISQTLRKRE